MSCCLHVSFNCTTHSPAPVLVHKMVGVLESIEKLPVYLYEAASTSASTFNLQVYIVNFLYLSNPCVLYLST